MKKKRPSIPSKRSLKSSGSSVAVFSAQLSRNISHSLQLHSTKKSKRPQCKSEAKQKTLEGLRRSSERSNFVRCKNCTWMNSTGDSCQHCGEPFLNIEAKKVGLVSYLNRKREEEQKEIEKWGIVEKQIKERNETACSICLQSFTSKVDFTMLNCSHTFHQHCLESFERFSRTNNSTHKCPVCRRFNYEQLQSDLGYQMFRSKAVILIQNTWRGFLARKGFYQRRKRLYTSGGGNPALRQRFFASEVHQISDKMLSYLEEHNKEVDDVLRACDDAIHVNRSINYILEGRRKEREEVMSAQEVASDTREQAHSSQVDWEVVKERALLREYVDCPICLSELHNELISIPTQSGLDTLEQNVQGLHLTSCSHIFHRACLQRFEELSCSYVHVCPVCRSQYTLHPSL